MNRQVVKDVKRGCFTVRERAAYGWRRVATFATLREALMTYPPKVRGDEQHEGVHWDNWHQVWRSYYCKGKVRKYLGRFSSKARAVAERKLYEQEIGHRVTPPCGGVTYHATRKRRSMWLARISRYGKRYHLGYYETRSAAEAVVDAARKRYWEELTRRHEEKSMPWQPLVME